MGNLAGKLDATGWLNYNILAWISIIEYKSTNILSKLPSLKNEGNYYILKSFS